MLTLFNDILDSGNIPDMWGIRIIISFVSI